MLFLWLLCFSFVMIAKVFNKSHLETTLPKGISHKTSTLATLRNESRCSYMGHTHLQSIKITHINHATRRLRPGGLPLTKRFSFGQFKGTDTHPYAFSFQSDDGQKKKLHSISSNYCSRNQCARPGRHTHITILLLRSSAQRPARMQACTSA